MAVSLISANLATISIESFLYGVFVMLYTSSVYFLVQRGQRKLISLGLPAKSIYKAPMFVVAHIIFCTVTGHWILTVYRLFYAFVNYEGGTQATWVYANLALDSEIVKSGLLMATLAASDAMIVSQVPIFPQGAANKWVAIPPLITWLGLIANGIGVCLQFAEFTMGEYVYADYAGRWVTADCIFTFLTNVYCSLLISWRVWRSRSRAKPLRNNSALGALAIIVESAAIQTVWNLIFFVLFQVRSNAQFIAIDLWSPMSGIAFMLINLRVALGWSDNGLYPQDSSKQRASGQNSSLTFSQQFPMQPLSVTITRTVDQIDDGGSFVEKQQELAGENFGEAV
ncbi:uncharacterized protein FIBRA_04492 [Fibroporia radiculosa]|uniref:Uncharacterized protein n=1 Tax=Fibroporia radiculosa TaxID=599839 RepID=J4H2Z7_9APHY|nr:uncharacterized protein FIBRA_04492 [Fibroporia radiculosa]CCM02394.1 predicted protein [Fibroporia radiculosa]